MNGEVAWALIACPILPTSLISRNYGFCGRNATAEEELFDKTGSRMHYVVSKDHVVGPVTNWQQLGNNPSRNVPEEHFSDCKCFR